jgi:protein-S-isoprenylcysteine O-methyltransferase Ste14
VSGEGRLFAAILDRSVSIALPFGFSLIVLAVVVDFVATRRLKVARRGRCPVATASMAAFCALMYPLLLSGIGFVKSAGSAVFTLAAVAGLAFFLLGTLINIAARFQLGTGWSDGITVYEGHRLVGTGLYGLVRHPLYASLILMLLGVGFIYVNALVLALTSLVFVPMMIYRARREEETLQGELEGYGDYRKRVPMFLPFARPRSREEGMDELTIDVHALRFCRIGTAALLLAALLSGEKILVFAAFVVMLIPAVFTIRSAPLYTLYTLTLGRLIRRREETVDTAAIRFAQGLGSTLLALALFCLYVLDSQYAGWIFAGSVAATTAFGAGGLCFGAWIYHRLRALAGDDA